MIQEQEPPKRNNAPDWLILPENPIDIGREPDLSTLGFNGKSKEVKREPIKKTRTPILK